METEQSRAVELFIQSRTEIATRSPDVLRASFILRECYRDELPPYGVGLRLCESR